VVIMHPFWDAVATTESYQRMKWVARPGFGIRQGAIYNAAYDGDMGDRRRVESDENLALYRSKYINSEKLIDFEFSSAKVVGESATEGCSVFVKLTALSDLTAYSDLKLFVDLIEDNINVGYTVSGITVANNVLRKILPDTLGASVGTLKMGETCSFSFFCPKSAVYSDIANTRLVAFVQDASILPKTWEPADVWPVTLEEGPYSVIAVARHDFSPFLPDSVGVTHDKRSVCPIRLINNSLTFPDGTDALYAVRIVDLAGRSLFNTSGVTGTFAIPNLNTARLTFVQVFQNGKLIYVSKLIPQ